MLIKNKFYIFLAQCLSILLITTSYAAPNEKTSAEPYSFTSQQDADRYTTLTQELRCVVCQGQSLADSNAPLAKDMRKKVYEMIVDKQSDSTIKQFFITRYGDFILLNPRFTSLTFFLWLFPVFAFLVMGIVFWQFFRKKN